ncbi:PREDICTED: protein FAR1-RELATED SEQUENCE 5-like [Fragaria vesca subsp. vesca]
MEREFHTPSNSNNVAISTQDAEATNTSDYEISSKMDFGSGIDLNGFVDVENNEVGGSEEESEVVRRPSENAELIHSRMRQELIPVVGIEFETEKDALAFYNRYAYRFGFGTRLSKAHTSSSGLLKDRLFVCSAEGKRRKDKRSVNISLAQNVQADMAEDAGLDPKETLELLSQQAGGRENLGFIPEDYKNYLRSNRTREMKSGDTGGVLEYLQRMQSENPSFSYAIQVDVDDLITNIFWADAKMKVDYDYFGDVVCFDTTYRKNKEGRPFAMFVGVNNHKQTLIFGAALLYDETAETFMWLFDTFANTMSGKDTKKHID